MYTQKNTVTSGIFQYHEKALHYYFIPYHWRKYIALRNQVNQCGGRLEGSVEYRRIYNGFQSYILMGGISVG